MRFPLADWIDDHADCRFDLGRSGMWGTIRHPRPTAREIRDAKDSALVAALAATLRVASERVFLTHGATEANAWVTFYLARRTKGRRSRCRVRFPECPPLSGMAAWAGLRVGEFSGDVPLAVVSQPRNPEGFLWSSDEFESWSEGARAVLVDETFREFSDARSRATLDSPKVWVTGTLTKAYAGDDIRVGWVVAPLDEVGDFARFHGLATDEIAPTSVAMALRTLEARKQVLGAARRVFEWNRRLLTTAFPEAARIRGPVYFDRPPGGHGDAFARRCLRSSVLVSPGSMFGDPSGVRLTLTRRDFPASISAYIRVRARIPAGRLARSRGKTRR